MEQKPKQSTENFIKEIRRKTRRLFSSEQKLVIVMEAQRGEYSIAEGTYNYIRSMVDLMLRKSGVDTDEVFVGGRKSDLCMWISGILEFYQYSEISIQDNTHFYDLDPDFDMPNKFR